jgi:hypothetical protein
MAARSGSRWTVRKENLDPNASPLDDSSTVTFSRPNSPMRCSRLSHNVGFVDAFSCRIRIAKAQFEIRGLANSLSGER